MLSDSQDYKVISHHLHYISLSHLKGNSCNLFCAFPLNDLQNFFPAMQPLIWNERKLQISNKLNFCPASSVIPSVLCSVKNVYLGSRVSAKGESKFPLLPSPWNQPSLRRKKKKKKKPNPHFLGPQCYWRQLLADKHYGFIWSAGRLPASHLDTSNTRTFLSFLTPP